jgi:zinc/manganese transport system substrate-binding protein
LPTNAIRIPRLSEHFEVIECDGSVADRFPRPRAGFVFVHANTTIGAPTVRAARYSPDVDDFVVHTYRYPGVLHMSLRRILPGRTRIGALVAMGLVVAGCGSAPSAPAPGAAPAAAPPAAEPVPVVASTNVYGSIARAVGGDRVAVRSIIDSPDADPHEYEASPADAAAVAGAKVMIVNGGGYDDFAGTLVEASAAKPAVIDVVELSGLRAAGQEEFNEHVWYSLPTVGKLADRLATDLAAADPAHAATYTANAAAFKGRIGELTARVDAIRAAHGGDRVAVTEPVPLYLVQDAGLENATPEEFAEASEEGTDPSAAVLNETLELFTGRTVTALLANTQTEGAATRQVAQAATGAGIPVVTVTETLPTGVDDYVAWQGGQIDQLRAALDRPAA